jgi:hypothetical protein
MEYTGFIKEYDGTLPNKKFNDLFNQTYIDKEVVDKIINYLSHGINVISWMHVIHDLRSNEIISEGHGIETDGIWFWPSYLPYYLRTYPNFFLEDRFLDYLLHKNFTIDWSKKSVDIIKMENELFPRLGNVT